MNARDALRHAAKRGVRVFLSDDGVVTAEAIRDMPDGEFQDVLYDLRPLREAIRAWLQEFRSSACATDAVIVAQSLLRDGVLVSCKPKECNFHCGNPGDDCRRCGATWHDHYPMNNSREPRFK